MENVGAVSFSDEFFLKPKDEESDVMKHRLAYNALHELSHMWFGNLVTMKWWKDVWLKESFADFMSVTSMIDSDELIEVYKNPDLRFVMFTFFGLHADVKSTTHPI